MKLKPKKDALWSGFMGTKYTMILLLRSLYPSAK